MCLFFRFDKLNYIGHHSGKMPNVEYGNMYYSFQCDFSKCFVIFNFNARRKQRWFWKPYIIPKGLVESVFLFSFLSFYRSFFCMMINQENEMINQKKNGFRQHLSIMVKIPKPPLFFILDWQCKPLKHFEISLRKTGFFNWHYLRNYHENKEKCYEKNAVLH